MIIYQALEITVILNSNNNVYTNFILIAYCVLKKNIIQNETFALSPTPSQKH